MMQYFKSTFIAVCLAMILSAQTYAAGFGSGLVSGHPEYDFAWYTLDTDFNFTEPPYAKMVSGTLYMGTGSENFPLPGIYSPYVVYNSSTIPCNGGNGGAQKKSDSGNDMMWCDGSGWVDVTTTLENTVTSTSTLSSTMGGLITSVANVSNSLPNYTLLTTYNTGISSLTTAVNGKVSPSTLANYALLAATTTSLTAKQNSLGTSASTAFLAGDLAWRVPAGSNPAIASQSRSLNTCYQISSSRNALATYAVDIATTLSLTGGQTGTVFLEYSDNNTCSTNTVEVNRFVNGNTGTLTIGLNITQNATGGLSGMIPAGKYVQIRTANTVGTPTFNFRSGQEVQF